MKKTKIVLGVLGSVLIVTGLVGRQMVMERQLRIKREILVLKTCQVEIEKQKASLGAELYFPPHLPVPNTPACAEAQRYINAATNGK